MAPPPRRKKLSKEAEYVETFILPYMYRKPSHTTEVHWIHAFRKSGTYPEPTDRSGKWLVFVSKDRIDDLWGLVRQATEDGRLGASAKVSTVKPNPNASNPDKGVICVYTYDWRDRQDVERVRAELRALGVTWKIPYKADEETFAGKYQVRGDRRISKYYE